MVMNSYYENLFIFIMITLYHQLLFIINACQVRNFTLAFSTMIEGLLYLLAFVFLFSGLGLFLLGIQVTFTDKKNNNNNDNNVIDSSNNNEKIKEEN